MCGGMIPVGIYGEIDNNKKNFKKQILIISSKVIKASTFSEARLINFGMILPLLEHWTSREIMRFVYFLLISTSFGKFALADTSEDQQMLS